MRVEKRNSSLTVSKITEARHGLLTGEAVSSSTMAEREWGGGRGRKSNSTLRSVRHDPETLGSHASTRNAARYIPASTFLPSERGRVLTMLRNFNSICSGSLASSGEATPSTRRRGIRIPLVFFAR